MRVGRVLRTGAGVLLLLASLAGSATTASKHTKRLQLLDLQQIVNEAIAAGEPRIELRPGTYRLDKPVYIDGASNLTIDGQGAVLIWTLAERSDAPSAYALRVSNSQGVTLRNFTMDFDPLPYTQGSIVGIGSDTVDVRIDAGYRFDPEYLREDNNADGLHLHAFEADTRHLKWDDTFMFASAVDALPGRILRFRLTDSSGLRALAVGDLIATGAWRISAMQVTSSSAVTIDGVTVWSSGGGALLENDSEGGSDIRMHVVPGPPPTGASQPRLWSSTRDGYHAGNLRRGSIIHDAEFRRVGDDMVNVFHISAQVESIDAATRRAQVRSPGWGVSEMLRPGDAIQVLRPPSFKQVASIQLESVIERVEDGATMMLSDVTGLAAGDVLMVPQLGGPGTTIRDSIFEDGVSTAITVKSPGARILRNQVAHMGQPGIVAGPDLDVYGEGPFPTDVIIEGNRVSDIGRSAIFRSPSYAMGAAIVVSVQSTPENPAMLLGNRQIGQVRIADNTVDNVPAWGLLLSNANGVEVVGNTFARTNMRQPAGEGSFWGLTPAEVVMVRDSERVRLTDNFVESQGAFGTGLATRDPSADTASVDLSGIMRR